MRSSRSSRRVLALRDSAHRASSGVFHRTSRTARCRGHQAARIQRIDRHVGLVAGVNRRRQFRFALGRQRKTRGEEHHHLAPRNGSQIFRQAAHRQQHGARSVIRFRAGDRGKPGGSHRHRRWCRGVRIDARALQTAHRRAQELRVGGKVLHHPQAAAEVHHGHQIIRTAIGFHEFCRCAARLNLIRRLHRGVVEEQNHVVLLAIRLDHRIGAEREVRYLLFLVVFVNLEITLLQVVNVVPFLVRNHRIHEHQLRFRFDHRTRDLRACRGRHRSSGRRRTLPPHRDRKPTEACSHQPREQAA